MTVGIYVRLSKEDKHKAFNDESESIQNQKSILLKYAVEQEWEVYDIYCDEDYAGTDLSRPAWNRMLEDAQAGRIRIVLCKTQSRFSRDMEIVEKYIHGKFLEWNVRFVSVVDNADTSVKGNKKSRQINSLTNDWFLEDLSDNIRRTLHNKHLEGRHTGSTVLYGYQRDPDPKRKGYLLIDEEAAAVVRHIYQLYVTGNGIERIAKLLNQEKTPSPSYYKLLKEGTQEPLLPSSMSKLWNKVSIRRILTNPQYQGHAVAERSGTVSYKNAKTKAKPKDQWVIIANVNPPIIEQGLFEQVQERLSGHSRSTCSGQKHPLSGKVYCGSCGASMESHGSSDGHGSARYRCRSKMVDNSACEGSSIEIARLEAIVLERIQKLVHQYMDKEEISNRIRITNNAADNQKRIVNQIAQIEKEKNQLSEVMLKLYSDRVRGIISEAEFLTYKQEFDATITTKKEKLEERLSQLHIEQNACLTRQKNRITVNDLLSRYETVSELSFVISQEMIDRVIVSAKGRGKNRTEDISIYWNF